MAELDPITVDITRYKLDGIANEMQSTLLRSSFSPTVKEGLDASVRWAKLRNGSSDVAAR